MFLDTQKKQLGITFYNQQKNNLELFAQKFCGNDVSSEMKYI